MRAFILSIAAAAVCLPVHAADNLARLQKERAGLEARLGRPATLEELAEELDLAPERVKELIPHLAEPVSLETPVGEDGETELGDLVEDRGAESPYESAARAIGAAIAIQTQSNPWTYVLKSRTKTWLSRYPGIATPYLANSVER